MQVILNSTLQIFIDAVENRSVDRDVCFMSDADAHAARQTRISPAAHQNLSHGQQHCRCVFRVLVQQPHPQRSQLGFVDAAVAHLQNLLLFRGHAFDRLMQTMLTCFDRMATVPTGFGICVWTLTHILNHRRRLISDTMMLTLVTTFTKPGAHRKLFHDAALDVLGADKEAQDYYSRPPCSTIGYFVIGKFVQSSMRIDDWRQSVGIMRCCVSRLTGRLLAC